MNTSYMIRCARLLGVSACVLFAGCDGVTVDVPNISDLVDGIDPGAVDPTGEPESATLEVFATNTNRGSGLAIRSSDGALFMVNGGGLFGPIEDGADVSTMTAIGATNLANDDLFDQRQDSLVLGITSNGEFWIGSQCCSTMAVVAPEGGDAVPYEGLLDGFNPVNVKPETIALVPDGFDGAQMMPGNLLVGEETTFSRLGAIDVAGDRAAIRVDNPLLDDPNLDDLNREAHHLAFGPDGALYSSRGTSSSTIAGIQQIAIDGIPTPLPGTFRLSADSFVVTTDGDIVIRGSFRRDQNSELLTGILIWSAATQEISVGMTLPISELSETDELVRGPDGTIYLSLPQRNEIVRVVIAQ
jgi:hypothetical protein